PKQANDSNQEDRHMPFERRGEHGPVGRSGLVKRLKQSAAKSSPINDGPAQAQTLEGDSIQHSLPFASAPTVEFIRVLEAQQGFRFAIAALLTEIATGLLATVVPDKGARGKSDPPAGLLKPPTDIYIIASLAVQR